MLPNPRSNNVKKLVAKTASVTVFLHCFWMRLWHEREKRRSSLVTAQPSSDCWPLQRVARSHRKPLCPLVADHWGNPLRSLSAADRCCCVGCERTGVGQACCKRIRRLWACLRPAGAPRNGNARSAADHCSRSVLLCSLVLQQQRPPPTALAITRCIRCRIACATPSRVSSRPWITALNLAARFAFC